MQEAIDISALKGVVPGMTCDRFSDEGWVRTSVYAPSEMQLTIYINQQELVSILCTPTKLNCLALGFLYTEGIISGIGDVAGMRVCEDDSLADVISFGLAPSVIMYQLILQSPNNPTMTIGKMPLLPFAALLLVAAGAYRLAKFNTDPSQSEEFKGLPIPSTGLFIASLPLIINQYTQSEKLIEILQNQYVLLAIIILLSWLMVSNIPMISLKFKNLSWKDNRYQFILIGALPVLFIFFRFTAVPMIIFLYIILSVISLSLKTNNS